MKAKEQQQMTKEDFEELLKLKGWTKRTLAKRLNLGENLVYQWYSGSASTANRVPRGPAEVLMKLWLKAAREEDSRIGSTVS